jgi:iron complex outermembrane receptor protein
LFYLHANKHDNEVDSYNLNPGTINGGAFPVPIIGVLQEVDQRIVDEVGAIFGEVSYAIVGPLRLTLGGRGQWERKSGTSTDLPSFTPGVPFNRIYPLIFATASADYADTWRSFTPKATLDYQANDRWLIYATTAKGYKSGGWDTSAASDYGKSAAIIAKELGTPFKPETVWSYELGSKYEGADKRFVANAAAFIADYSDMQDNQFNPATGVFVTSNVAKARVKGVEIEATDAATSWLTLGISYTYELARYSQYVVSATQNNTGNIIPLAPRHNIHLSAETNFSIPSVPGTMNFGGDYTYRTQVHFTDGNSEAAFLLDQSKFEGIANLHATWNSERNNWHVSLFSTNVTDRHSVVYATDVSGFYLTPAEAANSANKIYSVIRIPTRVVGVTLRHDF